MKRIIQASMLATLCVGSEVRADETLTEAVPPVAMAGEVNVADFVGQVKGENWSPAIQAAIDSVCVENGYKNGATVLFPPGEYRIDQPLYLGKKKGHCGVRLVGYGATLIGTETLDKYPVAEMYEARKKRLEEAKETFALTALPGELDFDGKNVGVPILEIWNPPGIEGAAFVVQGLTFTREAKLKGVGIKIPAETVPKNVQFRDIKVYRQNVGIHVNASWQIRFDNCLVRGNDIGVWGRNHFNAVSIVNCTIRRNHHHGLIIGPNAGSWGSSQVYIAGNIFEANKGYGILNAGGKQVAIINNYLEANGNSVGVLGAFPNTVIDANHFWGYYGHGWKRNSVDGMVVSDKAHIVVKASGVMARGNSYHKGAPLLLFALPRNSCFDACPVVAEGVTLEDGSKIYASGGRGAYLYDAASGQFELAGFSVTSE